MDLGADEQARREGQRGAAGRRPGARAPRPRQGRGAAGRQQERRGQQVLEVARVEDLRRHEPQRGQRQAKAQAQGERLVGPPAAQRRDAAHGRQRPQDRDGEARARGDVAARQLGATASTVRRLTCAPGAASRARSVEPRSAGANGARSAAPAATPHATARQGRPAPPRRAAVKSVTPRATTSAPPSRCEATRPAASAPSRAPSRSRQRVCVRSACSRKAAARSTSSA